MEAAACKSSVSAITLGSLVFTQSAGEREGEGGRERVLIEILLFHYVAGMNLRGWGGVKTRNLPLMVLAAWTTSPTQFATSFENLARFAFLSGVGFMTI